ncbi:DUF4360 domain-containing protein [Plantactinospora sp. B6F1]|uniref:DUF4360 domain-containing protein n=1 Tax=Plantactinospora sp. B6F1 TaxID=3158971 RepID=UPI00102C2551
MISVLAIGSLVASMLGGAIVIPTDPPVEPPAEKIVIEVITINGSGCPAGTAAVAVAPDNTAFTVTYSDYLAQVGVGARPTDSRKNCQLALQVHVPEGFTYAILQADYRGYAYLENGATAVARANYYFQGSSPTTYRSHSFSGPLNDSWQTTDTEELTSVSYAPCGEMRFLNINTELRVNVGTSNPATTTSFMAMDSTDGAINTIYHFAWKKCEEA